MKVLQVIPQPEYSTQHNIVRRIYSLVRSGAFTPVAASNKNRQNVTFEPTNKKIKCCVTYNVITTARGTRWTVSGEDGICAYLGDKNSSVQGAQGSAREDARQRTHATSRTQEAKLGR